MTDFQLFDALPAHIEDALRASIERFGVLVPVTKDQHGITLDGHHRERLAEQLGKTLPVRVVVCDGDDERREVARTLNSDRRHLSEDQRRNVVADLRSNGHSIRAIAGALGVGKSTVDRDLDELSQAGQLKQPERVTGMDGKSRPATRPAPPAGVDPDTGEIGGDEPSPACSVPVQNTALTENQRKARDEQTSRENATRQIAGSAFFLATAATHNDAATHYLRCWQPLHDNFAGKPTDRERLKSAAHFLLDLADRWPH